MSQLEQKWSLITGASAGMGVDYAHILAAKGSHLVLTARREQALNELASDIRGRYGVQVVVLPADLSLHQAREELYNTLKQRGIEIEVLINNAGFGVFGYFADTPYERIETMLNLDIVGLTHLTKLFTDDMKARRSGYVLQVASIGGYQPSPTYAAYAAAKAYVLLFGEALNQELKAFGVKVTVLSPGITATDFFEVSGQKPTLYQRLFMMPSRPVAELGVRSMLKGKASVIPGLLNNLVTLSLRLMPRAWQASTAHLLMKN